MINLKKIHGKFILTIGGEDNVFDTLYDALYHLKGVRENG